MKKFLALLFPFLFASSAHTQELVHEASMNFDLENVRPFLKDLDAEFQLSLKVDQLFQFTSSVAIEAENVILVDITIGGESKKMQYRVFMDDIEAPDIYMLFDAEVQAEKVGDFMMQWAEARGM